MDFHESLDKSWLDFSRHKYREPVFLFLLVSSPHSQHIFTGIELFIVHQKLSRSVLAWLMRVIQYILNRRPVDLNFYVLRPILDVEHFILFMLLAVRQSYSSQFNAQLAIVELPFIIFKSSLLRVISLGVANQLKEIRVDEEVEIYWRVIINALRLNKEWPVDCHHRQLENVHETELAPDAFLKIALG